MVGSTVIVVPARSGSKRLPRKNEKLLVGKSLLEHTADAVRSSKLEIPVLLTTDSENIACEGRRLGWIVPFLRPPELAEDHSPTIDAVLHALDWYHSQNGADPDVVVVLQPTSPLRPGQCLVDALAVLEERHEVSSVIGMSALHLPAKHVYVEEQDGAVLPVFAQDNRKTFVPNGAIYATRTLAIRQHNSLFVDKIHPLLLAPSQAVDIDDEDGWHLAESYLTGKIRHSDPFKPASKDEF